FFDLEKIIMTRHTRSDDLTPEQNLIKFLKENLKFLQREKKRFEKFCKENGINGNNLEQKLNELEKLSKKEARSSRSN
ncbi:22612_t:CDS:1, partial [Gigaspora rosea]